MVEKETIKQIQKKRADWEKQKYSKAISENPERKPKFKNLSNIEIKNLYTPEDIADLEYLKDVGFPGEEIGRASCRERV